MRIGFALTGSYCTFERIIPEMYSLLEKGYNLTPILSENAYLVDTRFGKAEDFVRRFEDICGKKVIHTINMSEPIGPGALFDAILIAPCTGNTLAKIANGITDTAVTMAAKAHLRNERPVVLAMSTNDGLSGNAENIGKLLNRRHVYFVPFGQDDAEKKPRSMIADFSKCYETIEAALAGKQLQPILLK